MSPRVLAERSSATTKSMLTPAHPGASGGAGGGRDGHTPQPHVSAQTMRMLRPWEGSSQRWASWWHSAVAPLIEYPVVSVTSQYDRDVHAPHVYGHRLEMPQPYVEWWHCLCSMGHVAISPFTL